MSFSELPGTLKCTVEKFKVELQFEKAESKNARYAHGDRYLV